MRLSRRFSLFLKFGGEFYITYIYVFSKQSSNFRPLFAYKIESECEFKDFISWLVVKYQNSFLALDINSWFNSSSSSI